MSRFGVEGNRGGTMTPISEWTLEQLKQFLDTSIFLGGDKEKVGVHTVLKAEVLSLAGCSCRTFFPDFHITSLEILQRRSQALFSSDEVTLDSLYVAPKNMSSSWTLEHHRRVVRAVIQLGGLNSSKTTAEAVLKLMDEEDRRQGLTTKMIEHHLVGLYGLQKETQRLMDSRNDVLWNGSLYDLGRMQRKVEDLLLEYQKFHGNKKKKGKRKVTKWVCPPQGRLKINVDGASQHGGIGVVVRNEHGTTREFFRHLRASVVMYTLS
ncbi:hypothetical protein ACLB2K_016496 [Fragaria x ananassa]